MQHSENVEKIRHICDKRPLDRSPSEINTLVELTAKCRVFNALVEANGITSHHYCCRYLKYQFCMQGQHLFRYGEVGTRFYIILHGTIGVEVPAKVKDHTALFIEVTTLSDGSSFGELALESSNPRAASIKCKTHSHFLYLEKGDYVRLVSRIVLEKRNSLVNFLQSLPMFNTCTKGTLTKLSYIFKEKVFQKGHIVYNEGDEAEDIYIVKHGEFEFYKLIKKHRATGDTGVNNKTKLKKSKIACLGNGEMFGEEDSLRDTKRISTCMCIANSSIVFCISKTVSIYLGFSEAN